MKNKVDKKDLAKKTLKIMEGIADFATTLDPGSMDFSTALEEMKDCTLLLEDGFSDEAVFLIVNQTTNGELYNLLKGVAKLASEIEHSITVTVERCIIEKFTVNACNAEEAMEKAWNDSKQGYMVADSAQQASRWMARDNVTGETTDWIELKEDKE